MGCSLQKVLTGTLSLDSSGWVAENCRYLHNTYIFRDTDNLGFSLFCQRLSFSCRNNLIDNKDAMHPVLGELFDLAL
jgi:hypothetical protein